MSRSERNRPTLAAITAKRNEAQKELLRLQQRCDTLSDSLNEVRQNVVSLRALMTPTLDDVTPAGAAMLESRGRTAHLDTSVPSVSITLSAATSPQPSTRHATPAKPHSSADADELGEENGAVESVQQLRDAIVDARALTAELAQGLPEGSLHRDRDSVDPEEILTRMLQHIQYLQELRRQSAAAPHGRQ